MKNCFQILFLLLIALPFYSQQFYFRGEVRDEKGELLANVNILQQSTGYVYRSGSAGAFGISSTKLTDTLIFSYAGYQKETLPVNAEKFIYVKMKRLPAASSQVKKDNLFSFTINLSRETQRKWYTGDETYASLVENNFVSADKYPSTGIALNIDRASYSNIRRFINLGMKVPPDAIRIEEMLNYFNFDYQSPEGKDLFKIKPVITACPWNKDHQLFFVNLFSRKLNFDSLPPANLVFLIDISGSMDMPNRLSMLKPAFRNLTMSLREIDTVSIVIYGGAVGVKLFPTGGNEKEKIIRAIDELEPGGSTPGESGIKLAYQIAKKNFINGGNNRIILATDGDFNVGLQTEQELDNMITRHRQSGIYLTCLGVGMGNYKDSKIHTLASKGNGNYAYIDTYQEAEKVLLKEFTQTLYTLADDVYMQVSFDASVVKEYRLIGFDNVVSALIDTSSEIEGGEIGSGQSILAVFEIHPALKDLKEKFSKNFAMVNLEYKLPNNTLIHKLQQQILYEPVSLKELEPVYHIATSVIMFGSILKASPFTKNMGWGDVLIHAGESVNPTDINQSQFLELVYKTRSLYSKQKKKKGKEPTE